MVAKAIHLHWVTRYGAPRVVLADNEFRSNIMKELCKLCGSKQIFSAPYKPSTNGLCERVHGFALTLLQNACDGNIKTWDEFLPAVRFAIMTSKLDGLGFSPYQLLYGRHPRLPVDSLIPRASDVPWDVREYFGLHMEAIKAIRDQFDYTQAKMDARMRYKRDASQRRSPCDFKLGDLVYHTREYYNQDEIQRGLSKLLGKFAGPSPIVRVLGPNSFEVQVDPKTTKIFNAIHL